MGSVLVSVMWRFAVQARLVRADAADKDVQTLTKRLTPGLAGYMEMIALGLFLPLFAVFGYLCIALYIVVPFGAIRRRSSSS